MAPDPSPDAADLPAPPGPAPRAAASGALSPWARLGVAAGWACALLLVAAPFLPWVRVRASEAETFGAAVARAAAEEGPGGGNEGFRELGQRLAAEHELTGLDLVQWSREARARLAHERSEGAGTPREREVRSRAWSLLGGLVLGMMGAALLLACYLAWHRFARLRPPMQVVAGLLSIVGVGFALGVTFASRLFPELVAPALGHALLVAGGGGLLLVLVVTVRVRHLLFVFTSLLLSVAALALLGWVYVGAPGL